jgi:hypothetical protein
MQLQMSRVELRAYRYSRPDLRPDVASEEKGLTHPIALR